MQAADKLFQAAPMHDVGKIGIPDHIMLKPGPLDEEEWKVMRRHPEIGAEIIGEHDSPLLKSALTTSTGVPARSRYVIPRVAAKM